MPLPFGAQVDRESSVPKGVVNVVTNRSFEF